MKFQKRGFTLVELMIVMAILIVLASITFPMVSAARRAGQRTVAISNMHQLFLSYAIYREASDSQVVPPVSSLESFVKKEVMCDPRDTWTRHCAIPGDLPNVGSFTYVGAVEPFTGGISILLRKAGNDESKIPLFVSVFEASNAIQKIGPNNECTYKYGCPMPNRVLRLSMAGNIRSIETQHPTDGTSYGLTWGRLFLASCY